MRMAKFAGTFALFIAGMALLTFISLFVVGAYLASWPIMRVSPRARRLTSVMGLATAAMSVARAYGLDTAMAGKSPGDATEDTDATEVQPQSPVEFTDFMNWARENRGSFLTDTDELSPAEVAGMLRDYREGGDN